MTTEYTVKLPIFEGPLDLLLHLIKMNEMEITEITISAIIGQYLEYLRMMESLDLEIAGDFLVMAATLLNIKLRTLLPPPREGEEEQGEEELNDFLNARQLMQRLIEYRKFKEAALELGRRHEKRAQIFLREVALPRLTEAEENAEIRGDLHKLLEAFSRVIRFVDRRDYHQVTEEEYSVDDKMTLLRRRLVVEPRMELNRLFESCDEKIEMVVTLIAVLELTRLKELRIVQGENFGEVYIFRREGDEGNADQEGEAAELQRVEAEILANRTGLVDDGVLDEEDEDAELDRVVGTAADADERPRPGEAEPQTEAAPESDEPGGARIIDLGFEPRAGDDGADPEGRDPAP
ncbi:MAG TPA: segregation/condensation protein A [Candidatus Sumerlaeota bacterium]|nr:segregation/condensation protein A [Candidatus Sumerlaeota bacterium]